jgi:hypothetical protein
VLEELLHILLVPGKYPHLKDEANRIMGGRFQGYKGDSEFNYS